MIDLHCHILPRMDDGAADSRTSLRMLRAQQDQGVTGLALTPHFYRSRETAEDFLTRRQASWDRLRQRMDRDGGSFPDLVLGAEVAWVPNLHRWEELERLCLGQSRYLLLELPFTPWSSALVDQLYGLLDRGDVTPILAHPERFARRENRDYLREILSMGMPIQLTAGCFCRFLDRRRVRRFLQADFHLVSDCHNLTSRPPDLRAGLDALGPAGAEESRRRAEEIFAACRPGQHHTNA